MTSFYKINILFFEIFLLACCFLFPGSIFSQSSPMPSVNNSTYKNFISYQESNNTYFFNYSGDDGSLSYEYNLAEGGSFNGIKVKTGEYVFHPSYFGGVSITSVNDKNYYIWSEGIERILLNSERSGDTVISNWIMKKEDEFYFHYQFKISIEGKSLIVEVKDMGKINNYPIPNYGTISSFQLDRSESTIDPVIIGIPYLSTINLLYTRNNFISMFFDWTKTNSSEITPLDNNASGTSSYYSQQALYHKKTNGNRNKLFETIYLTVSTELEEVLPNIPNPVAKFKTTSVNHLVYDNWDRGFQKIMQNTRILKEVGIDSLWLIVHNWQNGGYDNKYPDVLPANQEFGGNAALKEISALCRSFNFLFSVHENYSDIYPNAESYKESDVAIDYNKNKIKAWKTDVAQSLLLKPSKVESYILKYSTEIHETLETNSSFIDVLTARTPSENLDYDSKVENAGKSTSYFRICNNAGELLRKIHNGPVSAEGYHHFYYIGYYDDFAAQIQTAKISNQANTGGYYKPLLVDFDLRKMHDKTLVHGMGYYERFFHNDSYWQQYMGRSKDSAMIYSATELAYGHGGFFSSLSYDPVEQASLEYRHVYPMQLLYGNAMPVKILYNDKGILITVSEYIKKHPKTFDDFYNEDFLSQVFIEYDNGVKVYVNRHPTKAWEIFSTDKGWYNYNGVLGNEKSLYTGNNPPGKIILPKSNGWLCYSPNKPEF